MADIETINQRVSRALERIQAQQWDSALLEIFPVVDNTAKRRYPNEAKVGKRFTRFLRDDQEILTYLSCGSIVKDLLVQPVVNGVPEKARDICDAIYELGRCSLLHEGQLDERLKLISGEQLWFGSHWGISRGTVIALLLIVVIAKENADGKIPFENNVLNHKGKSIPINFLWGRKEVLVNFILEITHPHFTKKSFGL